MIRTAYFSGDRTYRYNLRIVVKEKRPLINFIMLNPSTADEVVNDPTVERCCRRAEMWGFGGVIITNIFAFRSTNPALLALQHDPVGPENDLHIVEATSEAECIVCGWGQHGALRGRSKQVLELLTSLGAPLYYLKLAKNGEPYHPLYLPYDLNPQEWRTW